ncbi:MAG: cysteine--tRNA ligase [Acidobacteria bacterium]|nr:cysteine--tRNA ligase [Acidobacteriota bacterium]MBI3656045.1 cysteine--tRNA ligase [Acidobacteriota bacterium]
MPLRIVSSLSKRREDFQPIHDKKIGLYVCGLTVYDVCHIGHARTFLAFDAIVRYLRFLGYDVTYVRNFTDVEDKIIKRALQEGVDSRVVSERYIRQAEEDFDALGMIRPSVEPKVTEHMGEIIAFVQALMDKGVAYAVDGDVYYEVNKFSGYGKLSRRTPDELQAGARVDIDERKRNPLDFALWKSGKPGEPVWESPWGLGRPGWHIECSAMATKYLGDHFDIHAGGADLVFPHHENEIAQSEAVLGGDWVKYWLHCGTLNIHHEKMSKSLGNYLTIQDALRRYHPEVLRFFILSFHYGSIIDFSDAFVEEKEQGLERLYHVLQQLDTTLDASLQDPALAAASSLSHSESEMVTRLAELRQAFIEAMNDDFNTAEAAGVLFQTAAVLKKYLLSLEDDTHTIGGGSYFALNQGRAFLKEVGQIFGIFQCSPDLLFQSVLERKLQNVVLPLPEIQQMISDRSQARKTKDWKRADAIRQALADHRILVQDTPEGTTWSVRR